MADTTYRILVKSPSGDWQELDPLDAPVTASSANAAIRNTVTEDGAYIAIPSRSWKPLVVTFQTKPTVKAQS